MTRQSKSWQGQGHIQIPTQNKFLRGPMILFTVEACQRILSGEWLIWGHKPYSPKWTVNWSLVQIDAAVRNRTLFKARVNPEWKPREETKP